MLDPTVINADVDAMFADAGQSATWNGAAVTLVQGRKSLVTEGSMRKWVQSFIVRVSEVAEPAPGDSIVFSGTTWTISDPAGEPVSGGQYIWTVQAVRQERPTFRG